MTTADCGAYRVERVSWDEAHDALAAVRRTVFVEEQGVPETLEWDAEDAHAIHALARDGHGMPIGTGRLLPDGRIGRMAVLLPWRRRGVGGAILGLLVRVAAERDYPLPRLHAQTHALDFYARHGFVAHGDEFMEADIPHREMTLSREVYARSRASL